MPTIFRGNHDGRGRRFAIVVSRFSKIQQNGKSIGDVLLDGCVGRLREAGVSDQDIYITYVPGAFELPLAAKAMAERVFEDESDEDDDEEGGEFETNVFSNDQDGDDDEEEFTNGDGNGNGHHDHGEDDEDGGGTEITIEQRIVEDEDHVDAVITLGCIIRGDTPHFDYIAGETARGIATVSLSTGVPVIFGVLTCDTAEQALARSGGAAGHIGVDAAEAALETADVHIKIREWGEEY